VLRNKSSVKLESIVFIKHKDWTDLNLIFFPHDTQWICCHQKNKIKYVSKNETLAKVGIIYFKVFTSMEETLYATMCSLQKSMQVLEFL
jgi:hypothetical protein